MKFFRWVELVCVFWFLLLLKMLCSLFHASAFLDTAYCLLLFVVLFIFFVSLHYEAVSCFFSFIFHYGKSKHIQVGKHSIIELPFIQHPASIVINSRACLFLYPLYPLPFHPAPSYFRVNSSCYHFLAKYFRLYLCKIRNKKKTVPLSHQKISNNSLTSSNDQSVFKFLDAYIYF